MNIIDMYQRSENLKQDLKTVMKGLRSFQNSAQLPPPEDSFLRAEECLDRQDFTVVVCGEVKQGKSTFINTLLGKELLPVAEEVATSQVFRISNAASESFFLVFSDGTKHQLANKEELVKYGTEIPSNLEKDPLILGRNLQWIEVNTPAAFLPSNVHLLDTPGLGALYCSHAEITHRYVAEADAVIFLKSAKDPLVDTEINFLKEVFQITPNVLFIQSKVDLFDQEVREEMQTRNQEILNKALGDDNPKNNFTFWPISSRLLFEASQTENEKIRLLKQKASKIDEVQAALSLLIFRTIGYTVAVAANAEASQFQKRLSSTVQEECKLLTATTTEEREKIQNAKKKKQLDFNKNWGQNGEEVRALLKELEQIIRSGRRSRFSDRKMGRNKVDCWVMVSIG